MAEFIIRRIKNNKGAMENILVTLMLVIIGVGALIGLASWFSTEENKMKTITSSKVDTVTSGLTE